MIKCLRLLDIKKNTGNSTATSETTTWFEEIMADKQPKLFLLKRLYKTNVKKLFDSGNYHQRTVRHHNNDVIPLIDMQILKTAFLKF